MPLLHDPAVRASLEARLANIRPDSPRHWGSMSVSQMLWHVNLFIGASLGDGGLPVQKLPLPGFIMRFATIYFPWPKGAPTNKGALAKEEHDFATEHARCKELIARFVAKPIDSEWPVDPTFDTNSGTFASKLQARHLDHHFKQFGA